MPGCVLRAGGEGFDAAAFLRDSPWQPVGVRSTSFNLLVSECGGADTDGQVEDALSFLTTQAQELGRLTEWLGTESPAVLDFSATLTPQYVARSVRMSRHLIEACAQAGVGIEVSIYLCSDND